MNVVAPLVFVLVWMCILFGSIPWLFSQSSGWREARALPFAVRLRLLIPFSGAWRASVSEDVRDAVARWRRRIQIAYWLGMVAPSVVFYGALILTGSAPPDVP